MSRVLVVDDNAANRRLLAAVFGADGLEVELAEDGASAIASATRSPPAAVVLDLCMPGLSGLETLAHLHEIVPDVPVVMLTSHGDVPSAVEAIQRGAYDFLVRPIHNEKLLLTVHRAMERGRLVSEVRDLRRHVNEGGPVSLLQGSSAPMRQVVERIRQVGSTSLPVLVQGETGTGKELAARALHQASDRRAGPFIALDCGAIPEALLESELFGHERGAFTGADRRREGHFRSANGGTLFLDEVGNLGPAMQAKLLRVLQERSIQPLGGSRPIPVDVRIVAATNDSLQTDAAGGRFRQDLYFRLAEFVISLPPLRDRDDDVLFLARRFQEEAAVELRRPISGISEEAGRLLRAHPWPGNVRELRNVVRQAVLGAIGPRLEVEDVRPLLGGSARSGNGSPARPSGASASLKEVSEAAAAVAEKQAIVEALRSVRWNKTKAAHRLQVDFKTLHVKMKRYGIDRGPD